MNKYRPENIKLTLPTDLAGEFEPILQENLHRRARLKRKDKDGQTVFSFWPTKSEYFLISIMVGTKCRELGGKPVDKKSKQKD